MELAWTRQHLEITVTDDGHADGHGDGHGSSRLTGPASGFGLAGIRERAALYGGTATAGPRPMGGWTVTATIPVADQAAP